MNKSEDSEEEINNDFLKQLHLKLIEIQNSRKTKEQETQILNKRINGLKSEEKKMKKNNEIYKKKIEKEIKIKNQYQEKLKKKNDLKEKKKKELEELQIRTKQSTESKKEEIRIKKENHHKMISELAKSLKDKRKSLEDQCKYNKAEEVNNRRTKAEYIKSQQNVANEKRRAFAIEKKTKLRLLIEQKIQDELNKIQQFEKTKITLEKEEQDVVNRMKTTTMAHNLSIFFFISSYR